MRIALRHWRPSHLLAAWATYWVGLALVSLRTVLVAGFNATQNGGSITGGLSESQLSVTVAQKAGESLAFASPLGTVAAWVVVPPLVLWAAWLWRRERSGADAAAPVTTPGSLHAGLRDIEHRASRGAHEPRTPVPDER
jgi:hypothetical protein